MQEQAELSKIQQMKSVTPILNRGCMDTEEQLFIYFIKNNGIGPAIIKSCTVTYKGKVYNTDFGNFFYNDINHEKAVGVQTLSEGSVIPAGETIKVISFKYENQSELDEVFNIMDDFTIEYASIYDERWIISQNEGRKKLE